MKAEINITKTYKGRTAYSYVRTARVLQMASGNMAVVADTGDHLGCDGDHVHLRDAGGLVATLDASGLALKILDKLEADC